MAIAPTTDSSISPPDGGWGWMVVFGSFMIHLLADGMAYSYGVYVKALVETFDVSHSEVGFLGSLLLGITWSTGPIASVCVNKFGCKAVAIGGTIIAAFGFFISIFAPNIYFMYFSFGVIGGFGLGMAYLPSIVAVSFYFEKRRSFATGLAVCGSGIGTFVFAPLTQLLVYEYGWKGSLLIETGILLNCIACGAVFRPMEDLARTQKKKEAKKAALEAGSQPLPEIAISHSSVEKAEDVKAASSLGINQTGSSIRNIEEEARFSSTPGVNLEIDPPTTRSRSGSKSSVKPMDRKDKFYTASLTNIPLYTSNNELYKRKISVNEPVEDIDSVKESGCCLWKKLGVSPEKMKKLLDCSLMCDICFLLFVISNFLTSIGLCVPYVYLVDRAEKQLDSTSSQAAFLISLLGITNTVGRVVFGFLADFKWVNRLMLYNTVLVLCGLGSLLSALCDTYVLMAVYSATFGLLIGVYICMTPVVLVDLLGLERLSNAFGLVLLFQGLGGVAGPPMAGALYDMTHDYNNSFYLMGICIFVSGAMLYPIPAIQRCLNKKLTPEEVALGQKSAAQGSNGTTEEPGEEMRSLASA